MVEIADSDVFYTEWKSQLGDQVEVQTPISAACGDNFQNTSMGDKEVIFVVFDVMSGDKRESRFVKNPPH